MAEADILNFMDDDQVRVYVAAGHTAANEARVLAQALEAMGAVIVSQWFSARPVSGEDQPVAQVYDNEADNAEAAEADICELDQANLFIGIYNADSRASHAEFGYAFAKGMPCFVTSLPEVDRPPLKGRKEGTHYLNMIHWHPGVNIFPDMTSILDSVKPLIKAKQITCEVCFKRMAKSRDLWRCRCGATREMTSLLWKEEAVMEHVKSGCRGVIVMEEHRVWCPKCSGEWRSQSG